MWKLRWARSRMPATSEVTHTGMPTATSGRRPAGGRGRLAQRGHREVAQGVRPGHPRDRAVRQPAGEAQQLGPQRRHQHRRDGRVRHRQVAPGGDRLAPVAHLLGHRAVQRLEVLLEVTDRPIEGDPPAALDHRLVRGPDAEHQAAADQVVRGQRLLRQHHRVAGVGGYDGGGEADVRRGGPHRPDDRQRVHAEGLRHPVAVEALGGRLLQAGGDPLDGVDEPEQSQLHGSLLLDDRADISRLPAPCQATSSPTDRPGRSS